MDFRSGNSSNSFRVFIYQPKTGGFAPAPELSQLTRDFMGMFEVDAEKKRLIATSRAGCCAQMRGEYSVHGSKPTEELLEVVTYNRDTEPCTMEIQRTERGHATKVTRSTCGEP